MKLFNSNFEISSRILILLDIYGIPMPCEAIKQIDILSTYCKHYGISDENLHGDTSYALSEVASRSELINEALKLLVMQRYVYVTATDKGFLYSISSIGKEIHRQMVSDYATDYFNSLLVLSLRCYFNEHAEINPHFYLLDSPLHGLMTETSDENNEDDLRKGFFNYLFNNYGNDQIIVIENTEKKELPKIDFDSRFVKVYTFTKDENNGRYGFLDGVFQN